MTVDGVVSTRLGEAIGAIPSVTISPADVELVRGGPAERRRYLDVVLATTSRPYLSALQTYRPALLRRNAALRDAARRGGGRATDAAVEVWEPQLAESGAVIRAERAGWVARWEAELARLAAAIGEGGGVAMRYEYRGRRDRERSDRHVASASGDATADDGGLAAWRHMLRAALRADRASDLRRGMTQTGPHRDDLVLAIDGRPLPAFASAGQQRTVAIVLRLLEAETLRARAHEGGAPVVLLDDPFAELDDRRAHAVLDLVRDGAEPDGRPAPRAQLILAVPRAADIPRVLVGLERWRIASGVMERSA